MPISRRDLYGRASALPQQNYGVRVVVVGDRPDELADPTPAFAEQNPASSREVFNDVVRISNQQTVLRHLHPRSERARYDAAD